MKRKQERLAAKLAFDEVEEAQAEMIRRFLAEDAEATQRLSEYEGIRADLKKMADRTPVCTLSTERLRDAILGDGLDAAKNPRQNWNWVLAPVATGVLAFAFFTYNNRLADRGLVAIKGTEPAYANITRPGPDAGLFFDSLMHPSTAPPVAAVDASVSAPSSTPRGGASNSADARTFGRATGIDLNPHLVAALILTTGLKGAPDESPAVAVTFAKTADKGLGMDKVVASPEKPPASGEGLVLIGSDTDGDTGAPRAKEVESFANVSIGG
jgi:hypothetical protein